MKIINEGITYPQGYKAWGAHVGLKYKNKDLSMVYSEEAAVFTGLFTKNKVKAAPVKWNMAIHDGQKPIKGLVINSGNANACTGLKGEKDVVATTKKVSEVMECLPEEVLVASTGVIGVPLPIDKLVNGIEFIAPKLNKGKDASDAAAAGIMTTDTYAKQGAMDLELSGGKVMLGGMAKGSGMIHPNMATMLSFITCDAVIEKKLLQEMMADIVKDTYNMISVDGDTSTNDMVLVMTNGVSGVVIEEGTKDYQLFKEALLILNEHLAKSIVKDGEGAGKTIEVKVTGAKSKLDGQKMAKAVVSSNLVKTAFFGEDANWGRILCAMGYSEADFSEEELVISFAHQGKKVVVYEEGLPKDFDEELAYEVLKEEEIQVLIELKDGDGEATAWGCDLSYEYVRINGDYRT